MPFRSFSWFFFEGGLYILKFDPCQAIAEHIHLFPSSCLADGLPFVSLTIPSLNEETLDLWSKRWFDTMKIIFQSYNKFVKLISLNIFFYKTMFWTSLSIRVKKYLVHHSNDPTRPYNHLVFYYLVENLWASLEDYAYYATSLMICDLLRKFHIWWA